MERSPEVRAEPIGEPLEPQAVQAPEDSLSRRDGPNENDAADAMRRSYREAGEQPPLYYGG